MSGAGDWPLGSAGESTTIVLNIKRKKIHEKKRKTEDMEH